MPVKPKSKGGFRIHRKAFGLTYSCPRGGKCKDMTADEKKEGKHIPGCGCENPIQTHAELVQFLDDKGGYNQYIVGQENHKSGKVHWHVYVKYDVVVDSADCRYFDCKGLHPNIVDGAPSEGWKSYCTKEKNFETNFYGTNAFKKASTSKTTEEAIDLLWKEKPEDMCKHGERIEANLRKKIGSTVHQQKRYEGPYPVEFYPKGWNPDTHALLLVGPPGLGKTQYARYLLGTCDYIKGRLDNPVFRECQFDKPLLFDEINMLDADPEQSKEVTDVENGGTINLRYKNVSIKPGIRRVFVHNIEHPFRNPNGAVYGRRVHTHIISGPCAAAALAAVEAQKAADHAAAAARHMADAFEQFAAHDAATASVESDARSDGAIAQGVPCAEVESDGEVKATAVADAAGEMETLKARLEAQEARLEKQREIIEAQRALLDADAAPGTERPRNANEVLMESAHIAKRARRDRYH